MRKPNPSKLLEVYESIPAASAAMKLSEDLLKQAKDLGCPCFRGHRVYTDGLKKWITANGERIKGAGGASLKDQKTALEIRKLTRIEETATGLLVKKADVCTVISKVTAQSNALLTARFVNEYPSRGAGMDAAGLRDLAQRACDEVRVSLQSLESEFSAL